jgi:phage terminase large subunit-like protein
LADPEFDAEFYAYIVKAPSGADHTDPEVWKAANPSYGVIMNEAAYGSQLGQQHEYELRRFYLNQWTTAAAAWLPAGAWDARATGESIPDGARVVLGFDGSYNNDSTALVAVTCDKEPHVDVVAVWERPPRALDDWTVPALEVEDAIRAACQRWRVAEIVCDPYRWKRTMEVLEQERLPVLEFPQRPERMIPATQSLYEAVVNGNISHSGDGDLARHVRNATVKVDSRGSRIVKESKASPRKVDLAVAAVMAFDGARYHAARAGSAGRVVGASSDVDG